MATKHDVEVSIGGNTTGLSVAVNRATAEMGKIFGAAEGIKGMLAETFGFVAIALAIENLIEFTEEIVKGSEALDIATDEFQALKIMAREAGTSMEFFTKIFPKIATAAQEAFEGSSKQLIAFSKLGLTQADLQLGKLDRLKKMMAGAGNISKAEAMTALRDLGLGKQAGRLLMMQPGLSDFDKTIKEQSFRIASAEQLVIISELKDKFAELFDFLKVSFIPVLSDLAAILLSFKTLLQAISNYLPDMGKVGNLKASDSLLHKMVEGSRWLAGLSPALTKFDQGGEDMKEANRKLKEKIDFEKNKEKGGGKDIENIGKRVPIEFESNQFLKVGGLMGVDINNRLQDIAEQQVEQQKITNDKLDTIIDKLPDKYSGPPIVNEWPLPMY